MTRTSMTWDMATAAIGSFITSTLSDYNKLSDRLHAAAIMAFVHAADHGDPSHLNTFFFGIRENDQNMLKAWLLKFSSYEDVVAGETVTKQWIGFRTKEGKKGESIGLFVKPKTEALRKGKFSPPEMYKGDAFFDTPDPKGKPMTLETIYAFLSKIDGQLGKKEEKASEESADGNVEVDNDLHELTKNLSAMAALRLAALKAAKPAVATIQ